MTLWHRLPSRRVRKTESRYSARGHWYCNVSSSTWHSQWSLKSMRITKSSITHGNFTLWPMQTSIPERFGMFNVIPICQPFRFPFSTIRLDPSSSYADLIKWSHPWSFYEHTATLLFTIKVETLSVSSSSYWHVFPVSPKSGLHRFRCNKQYIGCLIRTLLQVTGSQSRATLAPVCTPPSFECFCK